MYEFLSTGEIKNNFTVLSQNLFLYPLGEPIKISGILCSNQIPISCVTGRKYIITIKFVSIASWSAKAQISAQTRADSWLRDHKKNH
jgi:hypothetical protein